MAHLQAREFDADAAQNSPAVIFFGLLGFCMFIMAPMFWMMWMMRHESHVVASSEANCCLARKWKLTTAARQQRQQQFAAAAQQPIIVVTDVEGQAHQAADPPLVHDKQAPRTPKRYAVLSGLRAIASSSQRFVELKSQLLWQKLAARFTRPSSGRGRSCTGVSIDLPIMRQPAWQSLASGTSTGTPVTPSTTFDDISKPATSEVDITDMYRYFSVDGSSTQARAAGEAQKPRAAVAGLALG